MVKLLQPSIEPGDETPWGPAETVRQIAEGIYSITTESHGGIYVNDSHAKQISEELVSLTWLQSSNWFEEDSDWCIPYKVFEDEILEGTDERAKRCIAKGIHVKAFRML